MGFNGLLREWLWYYHCGEQSKSHILGCDASQDTAGLCDANGLGLYQDTSQIKSRQALRYC
jgi:hypothetical protein